MAYRFETERRDFSDLAAGRVLHAAPGATAFPVRLGSELLQRALVHVTAERPLLWDPCCGGGYLLTVLGFLHGDRLRGLVGSDIEPEAVELCERNLALLTVGGLAARAAKLERDLATFGKDSHRDALASARRLRPPGLSTRTFVADAADGEALARGLGQLRPEVVVTDVPHGELASWHGAASGTASLLTAVAKVLNAGAIVAVATGSRERPAHDAFRRLARWQVGNRACTILRLE